MSLEATKECCYIYCLLFKLKIVLTDRKKTKLRKLNPYFISESFIFKTNPVHQKVVNVLILFLIREFTRFTALLETGI